MHRYASSFKTLKKTHILSLFYEVVSLFSGSLVAIQKVCPPWREILRELGIFFSFKGSTTTFIENRGSGECRK